MIQRHKMANRKKQVREVFADLISLNDLDVALRSARSKRKRISKDTRCSTETGLYIKRIQCRLKPRILKNDHFHRPLEFVFDPGDFIRDPSKIIPYAFDHSFDGSVRGGCAGEVELDGG